MTLKVSQLTGARFLLCHLVKNSFHAWCDGWSPADDGRGETATLPVDEAVPGRGRGRRAHGSVAGSYGERIKVADFLLAGMAGANEQAARALVAFLAVRRGG